MDEGFDFGEKCCDVLLFFGGDLEAHVRRRLLAGAFDGGNLEAEVDDVVGLVLDEFFEPDEELLVAELAGDLDAGAGRDLLDCPLALRRVL